MTSQPGLCISDLKKTEGRVPPPPPPPIHPLAKFPDERSRLADHNVLVISYSQPQTTVPELKYLLVAFIPFPPGSGAGIPSRW